MHVDKTTVLEAATLANEWELVQRLIERGADVTGRFQGRSGSWVLPVEPNHNRSRPFTLLVTSSNYTIYRWSDCRRSGK